MKKNKVIGRKMKRVTSIILLFSMLFTLFQVPMYANNVANVTANEKYFSKAVSVLTTLGIFEGYPDGSMGENNRVTRAEMVTIAVRLLDLGYSWEDKYIPTKTYPDVAENHWAVKYLSKAHETTLAVGDPDGNFRPDDDVILVEAIKMILVAGGHGYDKNNNPLEWYEGYKKVAKELKMLDGILCGDNEAVSRGAIILMVYKMLLSDVTMPEVSLDEGTYIGIQEVELSTDLSNAKIYYTLDGNDPDIKSAEYKKTIKISETTTLKAITVKDGILFSDVLEVTYKITDKVEETVSDEKNSTNKSEGDISFLPYIPGISSQPLQPSQTTYLLTIIAGKGGIVVPVSGKYASGTAITLTAIPSEGYKFIRWTSSSGGVFNNDSSPITTFIMPSNNTIITAIFEVDKDDDVPLYLLTVIAGEGGTVGQVSGNYKEGTVVSLTAIPNEDYKFVSWTSSNGGIFDDINNSQTDFIMPENNTTVTANFAEINQGGGYVRPYGSFTFNLTSSKNSNQFTLNGTITGTWELARIMYQVYSGDTPAYNESDFIVAEFNINNTLASINITDLMYVEGINHVRVLAEDIFGNQEMCTYDIYNDFGIHESPALTEEDMIIDADTGLKYAKNQLLVFFRKAVTHEQAVEFIDSIIDGDIFGYVESPKIYTVKLRNSYIYTIDELYTFGDSITAQYNDILIGVDINRIEEGILINREPNDPEWNTNVWTDNPSSNYANWGLEAIKAHRAWDKNYYMQSTVVGIIDSGFDNTHPDLNILQSTGTPIDEHGTHVAGIIGATPDNGIGITGVAWKARMRGAAANHISQEEIHKTLIRLLLSGARVINVSQGRNYQLNYVDRGRWTTPEQTNKGISDFITADKRTYNLIMETLVDEEGYDFLIVQAAGNDGNGTYENQRLAENNGFFSALPIDNPYRDKILVVGSVNNSNGSYTLRPASNVGERVDVLAPGGEIFSTVLRNQQGIRRELLGTTNVVGYDTESGTSMAAPHVTGIAAMLFGVNPKLTAAEVKDYIVSTANIYVAHSFDDVTSNTRTTHSMVNAEAAVEKAIISRANSGNLDGIVIGRVTNSATGEPIVGATVQFKWDEREEDGTPILDGNVQCETITTVNGFYMATLPIGAYRVIVEADGYYKDEGSRDKYAQVNYPSFPSVVIETFANSYSVALLPVSSADTVTITLSWGPEPKDLDSHLIGQNPDGAIFHTYYANKTNQYNGEIYTDLDHDDTRGNGVEHITIYNLVSGTYTYAVHDYSNKSSSDSNKMALSGAKVTIAYNNRIQKTYFIPYDSGTVWTVFKIEYTEGGEIQITDINTLGFESNSNNVGISASTLFISEEAYENEVSEYLDYVFINESIIDYLVNLPEKFEIYN